MTQAGLIYNEDGTMDNGIWEVFPDSVEVRNQRGELVIKISSKAFTDVITDFCTSDLKPKK